jgi:hypothetical protein
VPKADIAERRRNQINGIDSSTFELVALLGCSPVVREELTPPCMSGKQHIKG